MHLNRIALYIFFSVSTLAQSAGGDLVINELMASNITAQITPDKSDFSDWIELYNKGDDVIDIKGIFITDDLSIPFKWQLNEDIVIQPNSFYIIWTDGLNEKNHTNFKLSAAGEQLGLYYPDGSLIDTLTFGVQRNDISYGRYPDGEDQWRYFEFPTPEGTNSGSGLISAEQTASPKYVPGGGLFDAPQSVSIESVPGITARYTLDGTIPTRDSEVFRGPITISETTVFRARGYSDHLLPSEVVTCSYVIDEPATFPVISITTPPEYLFDQDIGITPGICVSDRHGEPGAEPPFDPNANFWNRWERPVHIEYYTAEGIQGFSQDAGIAIFGGFLGRQLRQKAFTLFARDKYGDSDFDFPLFPSKSINSYRRFILRCSSNDFNRTFMRDAMMQSLVIGQMDIDYQAYQPVSVYINGIYWGLYYMREKTNQFYAEHNYGLDTDSVDLIEGINHTVHGDGLSYMELLHFVTHNTMSLSASYDHVKKVMDVEEFMNYYITELFVCNHDWLYQNIKCWRNHSYGGKWRWLLYDLDWGFSGELPWKTEDYMDNTFQWVQEQGDASLLFRKLMENEDFRFEFIQRFATHLNLTFNTDRVLFTIENMADWIAPEIPRQIERWGALRSIEYWNEQLNILKEFAINRPLYMGEHLDVTYLMEGKSNLVLEVSNEESGWISVFDTPCPGPSFSGTWYDGIPLQIKAHPKPGWRFVQWIGDYQSQEEVIEISFLNNAVLHAQFEPYDQPALMISEIHYNPSSDFQGDDEEFEFLELFNYEKERVDLSAYQFTEGITFTFPEGSYIDPGEFLLLASNLSSYDNSGVKCFQVSSGRLDNAGEVICLRDPGNIIIDQVHFDDHYPWPRKPDGDGPSLELIAPMLDNALPTSWQASAQIGGSPGYGHYTHIQKIKSPGNSLFMSVWPNPFYHNTKIRYSLDEESRISIRIFNSNGQEVEHLMKAKLLPGVHELMWTPSNIPEGIYFIHLLRGENIHTQKVFYSGKE